MTERDRALALAKLVLAEPGRAIDATLLARCLLQIADEYATFVEQTKQYVRAQKS